MADRVVSYDFRGNFQNLTAGLAAAGRSVRELGTDLTALDKNGAEMRQGLEEIGDTAGKIGLIAAVGLGGVIAVAANFEAAMSNVQAATGESAAGMEQLRDAALAAGADTAFSATEAAAGIEELSKAGVATSDILAGGLSGALDLAAAGGIEVAEAAETAASAMTQFGLSGTDVTHIADLLAAGAGKAQGSVSDFGAALGQSGLVAAQVGLSIEETTGALAAFASAGLVGSDAGTSFKTFLTSLTPASKEAATAMSDMGFSAYDADGNFKGLAEVAGDLQAGLSTMSNEQQNATLKTIFGSDAVRAASIIYSQGAEGIQGWIDKVNDQGYAAEQAATRLDNFKGDLDAFKGSLETLFIGAGEGTQGPLRSLVQGATDLVNALSKIPKPAQNAALGMLAITAVLGGGLWFTSKVVGGIAATNAALASLGITSRITAASLGRTAGALGILTVGLGAINDSMSIKDSMDRSSAAADTATDSVQGLADALAASNVGKYASDLGIDVAKLAEDLARGGAEGDYAAGILRDLGEASHGTGAMLNSMAGTVLPFYTANADKAYDANKDLKAIIEGIDPALREQVLASDEAAAALEELATGSGETAAAELEVAAAAQANEEAQKRQAEALAAVRDAAGQSAMSFFDLAAGTKKAASTFEGWLAQMEKQAAALRDFTANAVEAGEKGVKQGLIDQLVAMGPEGAKGLQFLADASEKEIARANRAFMRGQQGVRNLQDVMSGVPELNIRVQDKEGRARIERIQRLLDNFGMSKAGARAFLRDAATDKVTAVQRLVDKFGLTKAEARALLSDLASAPIAAVRRRLAELQGQTATTYVRTVYSSSGNLPGALQRGSQAADGATVPKTGLPYADRHLYMLADGEEIISNRNGQADRFRADRAAGRIPGYADGGTIPGLADGGAASFGGATVGTPNFAQALGFEAAMLGAGGGLGKALNDYQLAMRRLSKLTEKELHHRDKWINQEIRRQERQIRLDEREVRRDERAFEREKRETELLKDRVETLKQERDAIRDTISARLKSTLFSGEGPASFDPNAWSVTGKPEGFDEMTSEMQQAAIDRERRFFDLQQASLAEFNDPLRTLQADVDRAAEMFRLSNVLGSRGLDGEALTELLSNASIEQIREFANGDQARIDQYELLFNQRASMTDKAGLAAAGAEGVVAELAAAQVVYEAQLVVQRAFAAELKESNVELREHTKELRELNRRQDRIEKALDIKENQREARADKRAEKQSKDTGKAVGDAVNAAATAGAKGRTAR